MSPHSNPLLRSPTESRALVLMYHRIGDSINAFERRYCVEPSCFAEHMSALSRHGYRPCSVDMYFDWLHGRVALPERSFLLTFDDAFEGVFEHARPVLLELGWTATVFVVSGMMGGDDVWDAKNNPAGRRHRLMSRTQVAKLAAEGFSIQSHSRQHLDLTTLDADELDLELRQSRLELECLLDRPVRYLAYPFGRFNATVTRAAIDAGYAGAFSTKPGFNHVGRDAFSSLRLDIAGTDSAAALVRKMRFGSNDGSMATTARYILGRLAARAGVT